ncbi:2'-5' RNA ligase family protein (plasmid) [Streptomyces microflavus]|uniref:2'-5' RNA ligase family protein n=1 Tax=Streptomyces microflavus TaxID=1919 RepID=UPI002E15B3E2|nr:2'-5' RNA ligase family protein [Streptomyces microflavus]
MSPELDTDPSAFPSAPPASLDDPGVIVEHDWRAFHQVERMADHWDRPGWSDQQRSYYWMHTFPDPGELLQRAQQCQRALQDLALDLVPADGLHVTLLRVGAVDRVSTAQVKHLLGLAQKLSVEDFHALAHPLAGSRGAVRFSLTPWTPLVRLHAALSEAGKQAGVPGGSPTAAFRPHLGIAYSNQVRSAAAVVDAVAPLRSLPSVPLHFTTVELVELRRQDRAYRWRTVRSVPLRPAAASRSTSA